MTVNRRTLAKGAVWATPVIAASTLAPAIAASPCASYKRGQPLPASAFTTTYVNVTSDLQGGALDRKLGIDFGFKVSDQAKACGVTSGAISSINDGGTSRAQINNTANSKFNMTNGLSVPANGTVNVVDTSCSSTGVNTEACGTSGGSQYSLTNSTGTRSSYISRLSIYRSVTVSGYGTTVIYLNASIPTTGSPTYVGTNLSVSATPAF